MPDEDLTRDRKTQPTDGDVQAYLADVPDERRRTDAAEMVALLREVTGDQPHMWGTIIGFGRVRYTAKDGKTRETMAIGLAARRSALVLYGVTGHGSSVDLLSRLGPHSTGTGCLYVKRLDVLDRGVLRDLVAGAWAAKGQ